MRGRSPAVRHRVVLGVDGDLEHPAGNGTDGGAGVERGRPGMERAILWIVQRQDQVERAGCARSAAPERSRCSGRHAAVQVDAVDAQGRGCDPAHVRDAALHVHDVVVDERASGPAGVRHQGGIGHSGVRFSCVALVDLDDGEHGRNVVDRARRRDDGLVPEPVGRAELERIRTLRSRGGVPRIECEGVRAPAHARRRERVRTGDKLGRNDTGGIRDRYGDGYRRCSAVEE